MNRGVITISESGTVSMPTDTVWMTMQEIADMYNVFGCYVRKAVKAIFKDGILKEQGAPWYESAVQKWKGTKEILKPRPLKKNTIPAIVNGDAEITFAISLKYKVPQAA